MSYTSNDHKLAGKLLAYSVELKSGENILIQLNGLEGIGLARALSELAREMGANPFVRIEDSEIQRELMERGDAVFWKNQAETDQLPLMQKMHAFIGIRATQNIYEGSAILAAANKAYADYLLKPVHFDQRVKHTKWCVLRYPSPAFAMNAKMPTREFTRFFYEACLLDYAKLRRAMEPLEARLRKTKMIRLEGAGTNISFSVEGQNWIPCYGSRNIPDGELFSSPILDSVNGTITYAPSVYQGKPFEYVRLDVRNGVVVDFDSSDNKSLGDILDTDDGARRFGEFSFGTNPVIGSPMYDILFDEKIYGSNHLTLGQDYDEAANGNKSSVHWDLVCIGADVWLDDELVRKGRLFVTDDLKGLNPDALLQS